MKKDEFLDCTLTEIDMLLSEQKKYNSLSKLELANYIAALVMNDNAKDNYKEIYKNIVGEDAIVEDKTITYKRIKMISTRLKLNCPFIDDNGQIVR